MKKNFFIATAIFLFACNNEKTSESKPADDTTASSKVSLPAKMTYEGTATIGKTENIATVMNFNLDFIAGKFDNYPSYLADSVTYTLADGSTFNNVKDSAIAAIKAWRESMSDAKQSYISAIAVDNKEKGHEWVIQWIDESHDYKEGKKEHMILHEDYRLENGKIRELYQYAQAIQEKK